MIVTYQVAGYAPELVRARYVRRDPDSELYRFCEKGDDDRFDIRQGAVSAAELPKKIRDAADSLRHRFPPYVLWP